MDWFIAKAYAFTVNLKIPGGTRGKENPDGGGVVYDSFNDYLIDLVGFAINVAFALAILVILFGAFKYATSGGDETKIKDAKDIIVGAVVGFALLVLIRVLVPILGIN